MSLLGVLLAVGLLIVLAYRGWSVLLLAPGAALLVAAFAREPMLAHWTQTFMSSTAAFIGQFFPLFLLGALFGKLMDDSGSVKAIAQFIVERLGSRNAILAIVLAGAVVTYGGVSLFVAFFVLAPMAEQVFRAADIPRRLMPAAIALGTITFTMSAAPGTPAIQNAVVMPFLGTTLFAAPGLGAIASVIMLGFGMAWLRFAEARARRSGGFGTAAVSSPEAVATDPVMRELAMNAREFDLAEIGRGQKSTSLPPVGLAALPLVVVVGVNLLMVWLILPRFEAAFLAEERWGATSLSAVGGIWSVVVALAAAIGVLLLTSGRRLPAPRDSIDAGANAAVIPALTVASLVGFGAVVAAVPAFDAVRDLVIATGDDRVLVALAIATNILSALTGTAAGSLTITFETLGDTLLGLSAAQHVDNDLLHRVSTIGAGTLDSLPHNGAIIVLLAVCGATHRDSYWDVAAVAIIGPAIALATVIGLGGVFGSF